jgi:hypothetical protein
MCTHIYIHLYTYTYICIYIYLPSPSRGRLPLLLVLEALGFGGISLTLPIGSLDEPRSSPIASASAYNQGWSYNNSKIVSKH